MDFRVDHPYDCSAAELQRTLTDPTFLQAKFAKAGFSDVEIIAATPERVETRRVLDTELPGFAKAIAGNAKTIHQIEDWSTEGPEITGTFSGRAPGTPIEVDGTMRIEPAGEGCVLHIGGKAEARIPLLGGKIAQLLGEQVTKNLEREYEFTTQWIATHR